MTQKELGGWGMAGMAGMSPDAHTFLAMLRSERGNSHDPANQPEEEGGTTTIDKDLWDKDGRCNWVCGLVCVHTRIKMGHDVDDVSWIASLLNESAFIFTLILIMSSGMVRTVPV
jgi:hypothetical protein